MKKNCHNLSAKKTALESAHIAIVGNPNTGKSCLFNHLTGLSVTVSNYPGTTVELFQGKTIFKGNELRIVDLPGIYALDAASEDEDVTKNFLFKKTPEVLINIVDANLLERNLYLTLQLKKLGIPMIVALNFHEEANDNGITIDSKKLSSLLGLPVIPMDALRGAGVFKLMNQSLDIISGDSKPKINFSKKPSTVEVARKRHDKARKIIEKVVLKGKTKVSAYEWLDRWTTEPLSGSLIMVGVFAFIFACLFYVGAYLGGVLNTVFTFLIGNPIKQLTSLIPNDLIKLVLDLGLVDGINAGLQVAIPYIAVFYILLSLLEDSGYLPRIAYLIDRFMHKLKLHGKAVVPMLLGFGCSVPAILATRVMPNKRERLITAILINLIPCSARTAIILGATGLFLGWQYALLIYGFVLGLILVIGFILGRTLPGTSTGLIMEMPKYRIPNIKNVLKKTGARLKDFIVVAFPIIIVGSMILGLLQGLNLLELIMRPFEPLIEGWLLLPAVTGITLIYGILRKELALEMLILVAGTATLTDFMSPLQIFIFCLVATLYFPCIATFAVLKNEFGWLKSTIIAISTIILAVLIGGLVGRLFMFIGFLV
jgi:ferrous iron transport protein B